MVHTESTWRLSQLASERDLNRRPVIALDDGSGSIILGSVKTVARDGALRLWMFLNNSFNKGFAMKALSVAALVISVGAASTVGYSFNKIDEANRQISALAQGVGDNVYLTLDPQ